MRAAHAAAAPGAAQDPVLLLCAHGSRSPAARRTTARITGAVARALPGTTVLETWVDVQSPDVAQRCEQLADRPAVVVPLLLAAGYHVRHDLRRAVEGRGHHVVTGALGPDRRLSELLSRRLAEARPGRGAGQDGGRTRGTDAGGGDGPIVLIAAGSSDERAVADVRAQALDLERLTGRAVTAGFVSAARPSAARAVEQVRAQTRGPVAAASFLLSPGDFHERAAEAGADVLSPPLLGADGIAEEIVEIVLERRREGLARLSVTGDRRD